MQKAHIVSLAALERLAATVKKDYPALVRAGRRVGIRKLAALALVIDELLGVAHPGKGRAKGKSK